MSFKKSEHHLFQEKVYGFHYFLMMCEKLDKCTCNKSISLWQVQNCCAFQTTLKQSAKKGLPAVRKAGKPPHCEFPVKTQRKKKDYFTSAPTGVQLREDQKDLSPQNVQLREELFNLRPTRCGVERRSRRL